jgi:FKBP-type peptidyl-prolyl cis-trans isomerase FkpA
MTKRQTMLRNSRPVFCALLLWPLLASGCVTPPSFSPGPADPDAPTEFTQTESGLRYRILRRGTDPRPKATDTVKVHYTGTLEDGRIFDSSYQRGRPETFALSRLIPGWAEGLQLVQQGGMIELVVPPDLGYGAHGVPGSIPPQATLHFTVELIDIR